MPNDSMKVIEEQRGVVMKLKKRLEFKPKKISARHKKVRTDLKHEAEKHPHGARFGHRWFPYNKSSQ